MDTGRPSRNVYDRFRFLRRTGRPLEAAQIRWFGGSALSVALRTPVLVLHSTGRRTGRQRSTPLAFHRCDDGSFLVVGGAGGQARIPDWVANLRAAPAVSITVDRHQIRVHAQELTGSGREAAWREARKRWPRIDTYQQRAGREVPVFRLEPVARRVAPFGHGCQC